MVVNNNTDVASFKDVKRVIVNQTFCARCGAYDALKVHNYAGNFRPVLNEHFVFV